MKIFTSKQLRELDAYTIKSESTTSRVLMQRASLAMSKVILQRFSLDRRVIVFAGPGNNGGDALATAGLRRICGKTQQKQECKNYRDNQTIRPDKTFEKRYSY